MPNPSLPPHLPQCKTGAQFNPSRHSVGFYPPDFKAMAHELANGRRAERSVIPHPTVTHSPHRRERSRRDAKSYDRANFICGEIILADPAKYPSDSLPGVWARMVMDRNGRAGGGPTR